MTTAELVTAPSPPAAGQRSLTLAYVLVAMLWGMLAALLATMAYHQVFSLFMLWDDEGYMLLSQRHFLQGHPLYDAVYTQYGPFHYWLYALLLAPAGLSPTHDTAGLILVGIWVLSGVTGAAIVWRLTRSPLLTALGLVVLMRCLYGLASEPSHPQAECLLISIAVAALAPAARGMRRRLVCVAVGVLLGCLLLTKINVGLFVLIAVGLSFAAATPGRLAKLVAVFGGVAMLALPTALMRSHLSMPWARDLDVIITLAAFPVVLLHWRYQGGACLDLSDWAAAGMGMLSAIAVLSGLTVAHGTSWKGLFDGILLQHLHFAETYWIPAPVTQGGLVSALVSVVCYFALFGLRRRKPPGIRGRYALALLRTAFGLFVLCDAVRIRSDPLLNFALPFVWLALPPHDATRPSLARLMIVSITVLHALVAYPVAGTQKSLATALILIPAIVCLADAFHVLCPEKMRGALFRRIGLGTAGIALVGLVGFLATEQRQKYQALVPLGLEGASRLRLPEAQVAVFRWLCTNLRADADTFVTLPGAGSLYIWAGKEPATLRNPTNWMTVLDSAAQAAAVRAYDNHSEVCAMRNRLLIKHWLRGQDINSLPLVRYVNDQFETLGQMQGYEFRVCKGRRKPRLLYCAEPALPPPGEVWVPHLNVPPMPGHSIYQLELADATVQRVYCGSSGPGPRLQALLDSDNAISGPLDLTATPLDLGQGADLRLAIPATDSLARNHVLVIRLIDASGQVFASIPVLE